MSSFTSQEIIFILQLDSRYLKLRYMYYYFVRVASSSYRRDEPLTYSYSQKLQSNLLVSVPMQKKIVIGVIVGVAPIPDFATKEIKAVLDDLPLPESFMQLLEWLKVYYPASHGNILLTCLPSSLAIKAKKTKTETVLKKHKPKTLPPLTKDQSQALKIIKETKSSSFLLHGETGTGKTRIYIECAKLAMDEGESALIMTPEIGLVPQLVKAFEEVFGTANVVVFHSMLTASERRRTWLRALSSKEPLIIIGPRSALFTPVKNFGLVVMDEAHETAYKQEQAPYYQTSRVAATLAAIHGARFIIGTATPLVADYYTYRQKGLPIIRLSTLAIKDARRPDIQTVRLNDRTQFKRSAYISETLLGAIETTLSAKEQALVYLNRRGSARVILCQGCGWQAVCPNCDSPLVYHGDEHKMRCHICGFVKDAPTTCPECNHSDITFHSIGTKMIVEELTRFFPEARLQRFDRDNNKQERLEKLYESIQLGNVDILVGTQILSKGLDLPGLSLVGVVQADTSLLIPDYTADETTYQQLLQIIGRVGRGHRPGRVIIQSHDPDSPAIEAAIKHKYELFYSGQLKQRELFGFPPFYYLLKLTCHRASPKRAEQAAEDLRQHLRSLGLRIEIIGPSPAFHEKKANQHYWQLIVKAKRRDQLLGVIENLPSGWSYDIDPANLL